MNIQDSSIQLRNDKDCGLRILDCGIEEKTQIPNPKFQIRNFPKSLTENTKLSVLRLALEPRKRIQPAKGGSVFVSKQCAVCCGQGAQGNR